MEPQDPGGCQDDSGPLTWPGVIGADDPSYCVVHLDDECLYIRHHFFTQAGRDAAARALQNDEHPGHILGPRATTIRLSDIRELRLSSALAVLEIYHGPSRKCFELRTEKEPIHLWLYAALWKRLAPNEIPRAGLLSRAAGLVAPSFFLFASLLAGACFTLVAALGVDPKDAGGGLKVLIADFLCKIGPIAAGAIAL